MRLSLLVILALALSQAALAAPIPAERKQPVLYYPTQKGDRAVYMYDGGQVTHVVLDVVEKDKYKIVTMVMELDGVERSRMIVSVSPSGVSIITNGRGQFDTPVWCLKIPAKAGDKWRVDDESLKIKGEAAVKCVEEVEVPAGKYTAVRVEWNYTIAGAPLQRTYWYTPHVGMVKMVTKNDSLVLKSFTPAPKE